jgi:hypothetical protein
MKNTVLTVVLTALITTMLLFAVTRPMGRSEAHCILSECGTLVTTSNGMTYYMDENPLLIELEALTTLSEVYKNIRVVTTTDQ